MFLKNNDLTATFVWKISIHPFIHSSIAPVCKKIKTILYFTLKTAVIEIVLLATLA